jgi:dolichol-phosphate mannosyltransferase
MSQKFLTALPVFDEASSVDEVLDEVSRYSDHVLVVDDGSTDGTSELLIARNDIQLVRHDENQGYGAALSTAFRYAVDHNYQSLVTIDCDGQHEPQRICELVAELDKTGADIVSGSRYLKLFDDNSEPPAQRRWINQQVTAILNERLGFDLTDAFCGFKCYRASALEKLEMTETGYAMPLELWVQAACAKLTIVEVAVPLIYLDENRTFGGNLDDAAFRLNYYNQVLDRSFRRLPDDCSKLRELAG